MNFFLQTEQHDIIAKMHTEFLQVKTKYGLPDHYVMDVLYPEVSNLSMCTK